MTQQFVLYKVQPRYTLNILCITRSLSVACLPSEESDRPDLTFFRPMSVKLQQVAGTSEGQEDQWWVVEECSPVLTSSNPMCHSIEMVIFSDKVSPSSLGFLAGQG